MKEYSVVDGSAVLGVFSVYVAGVVIPGPNFVAVAHKAASATRVEALAMVAGIVLVNLFWASCAILGVGIVFTAFPWLALAVKLAGAGYLIWFGGRLIVNASAGKPTTGVNTAAGGFRQAFAQGFATNIANPKSMAFFAAVFSSAAPTHVSVGTFVAMLGMVGVVASSWYGFVALTLSHERIAIAYRSWKAWIDRVCGGLIVALGVRQLIR
jgi:threonine/homoserine/homoserine lactone efflux protein